MCIVCVENPGADAGIMVSESLTRAVDRGERAQQKLFPQFWLEICLLKTFL